MKSLESETVAVAEVQQQRASERERADNLAWVARRAPQRRAVLLDTTTAWMAELPQAVRPVNLARRFPRIANSIAELWPRGARCDEYLVTLVVDLRGDRTGFPPDVAQELTALRGHFNELRSRMGSAHEPVAQDD
jgi:hypothetical protein